MCFLFFREVLDSQPGQSYLSHQEIHRLVRSLSHNSYPRESEGEGEQRNGYLIAAQFQVAKQLCSLKLQAVSTFQNRIFQKKIKQGRGRGVEHGVFRDNEKAMWKFNGSILSTKKSGIPRGVQDRKTPQWSFHGSWFLILEFPRVSHNFAESPGQG